MFGGVFNGREDDMSDLPDWPHTPSSHEPFSRQTVEKASRLRGATVTEGLCPYCAVGCGQLIYTKGGKLIDIEGNPESPINEGTLCPKGANAFQLAVNPAPRDPGALSRSLLRSVGDAARSTGPSTRSRSRVKDARDADFTVRNDVRPPPQLGPLDRHARRRDDRQRGELPHQEAVRRRAGSGLDREPGQDMT